MCMGVSAGEGKGESHCVYIMKCMCECTRSLRFVRVSSWVFCCRASKQASALQSVYSKESLVFTSLRG